jgi:hypothetical protein
LGARTEVPDTAPQIPLRQVRPYFPLSYAIKSEIRGGDIEESSVCQPKTRWTSERMRRIIQRESTRWIGERLNISARRRVVIAIARRFLRDKFGSEDEDDLGGSDDFKFRTVSSRFEISQRSKTIRFGRTLCAG